MLVEKSKQARESKPPKPASKKMATNQSEPESTKQTISIQRQPQTQSTGVSGGNLGTSYDQEMVRPTPILVVDHSQKSKEIQQTDSPLQTASFKLANNATTEQNATQKISSLPVALTPAPKISRYLLPVREGRSIERMNARNQDHDDLEILDSQVLQNKITQDEYNLKRAEKVRKHIDETVISKKESETQNMLTEILKLKEEIQEVSESFRVVKPK